MGESVSSAKRAPRRTAHGRAVRYPTSRRSDEAESNRVLFRSRPTRRLINGKYLRERCQESLYTTCFQGGQVDQLMIKAGATPLFAGHWARWVTTFGTSVRLVANWTNESAHGGRGQADGVSRVEPKCLRDMPTPCSHWRPLRSASRWRRAGRPAAERRPSGRRLTMSILWSLSTRRRSRMGGRSTAMCPRGSLRI